MAVKQEYIRTLTGPEIVDDATGEGNRAPQLRIGTGFDITYNAAIPANILSITAESFAPVVTASIDAITDQITALSNSVAADVNEIQSDLTSISSSIATDINDIESDLTSISSSIATDINGIETSITNLSSSVATDVIFINDNKNHFTASIGGATVYNTSVPTFVTASNSPSGSQLILTIPQAQLGGNSIIRFNVGFALKDDSNNELYFSKDYSGLYDNVDDELKGNTIEGLEYISGAAETNATIQASSGLVFTLDVATGSNYKSCIAASLSKLLF